MNISQLSQTFVHALFVLATFVHMANILAVTGPEFDQILKVGYWDLFENIPNVTMTFVQATLILATTDHIKNISAVTDPILTKL